MYGFNRIAGVLLRWRGNWRFACTGCGRRDGIKIAPQFAPQLLCDWVVAPLEANAPPLFSTSPTNKGVILALIEFFNLFNTGNAAAVQELEGQKIPFGGVLQRLPGREGQVGIRMEF
jgi:hypothetical protein